MTDVVIPTISEVINDREIAIENKKIRKQQKEMLRISKFRRDVKECFENDLPSELVREIKKYRDAKVDVIKVKLETILSGDGGCEGISKKYSENLPHKYRYNILSNEFYTDIQRWVYQPLIAFKDAGFRVYFDMSIDNTDHNIYLSISEMKIDSDYFHELVEISGSEKFKYVWKYIKNPDPVLEDIFNEGYAIVDGVIIENSESENDYNYIRDIKKYETGVIIEKS